MTVILGGVNQNTQVKNMAKGVDILVATPGRLLDLVQQKHINLSAVNTFIVDEAMLRNLQPDVGSDERSVLGAFDKSREKVLEIARKQYVSGPQNRYLIS
jgi:superfamily II DNA/RNA helicase